GTRPRRGRAHSASVLRALDRGTRESDDALRSAGSWFGWRDCLTTLNVGRAPRVIRTPDLLIRSRKLSCPITLTARELDASHPPACTAPPGSRAIRPARSASYIARREHPRWRAYSATVMRAEV